MDKLDKMKTKLSDFIKERDWEKFHNPKDLAMSISIEANELLEHFQWKTSKESIGIVKENRAEVASEVADIMTLLIAFSNATGIDLYKEFEKKLELNNKRYPKDKAYGKNHKYTYYVEK